MNREQKRQILNFLGEIRSLLEKGEHQAALGKVRFLFDTIAFLA